MSMSKNYIEKSMSAFMDITFQYIYLPSELIAKIYSFVAFDYYNNVIYNFCSNYIIVKNNMIKLISCCLEDNFINYIDMNILLETLLKNNITRKYDFNMWAYILQILSSKMHLLRFRQRCNNISNKSHEGKQLVDIINLWFLLCKKYNFKLLLLTKNGEEYIFARNIPKITNYDKYIIAPSVIKPFSKKNFIDTNIAKNNLFGYYMKLIFNIN